MLLDDYFDAKGGVVETAVEESIALLEEKATMTGIWVIADGATDVCGTSVELVLLQCRNSYVPFFAAHPYANSKTADWAARQIGGSVDGKADWIRMEVPDDAQGEEDAQCEDGKKKPRTATQAQDSLKSMSKLGKYVFACCTDNCSTGRLTTENLRVSHALVECGDVSHAMSRAHQHVLGLNEIKLVVNKAKKIVDLFSLGKPRALLGRRVKRVVPTRFISCHAVFQDQADSRLNLQEVIAKKEFKEWIKKEKVCF